MAENGEWLECLPSGLHDDDDLVCYFLKNPESETLNYSRD